MVYIPFLIIPQLLLSGVIVEFDKLNPGFSSDEYVPITGEIMASKWAYEALAVHQFKNNRYQDDLFEFEKEVSQATFRKDYWIPELKKKVISTRSLLSADSTNEQKLKKQITLIRHEIERENEFNPQNAFEKVDKLTVDAIDLEVLSELRTYLDQLSRYYVKKRNTIDMQKDRLIASKVKTPQERDAFNKLRDDYYNESLGDLVLNSADFYRIIERNGKLIQRLHPIYQDPTGSFLLRSHFFAPRKVLFGQYVDTYWANIIVIWLMSIFLMVTLYFDALSKLLRLFEILAEKWAPVILKLNPFNKKA